jgi:hypothetical protein
MTVRPVLSVAELREDRLQNCSVRRDVRDDRGMSADNPLTDDLRMDVANLYREDVFSDLQAATIRRMTPVTPDGNVDPSRPVLFVAATHIMSQVGAVPISAQIDAKDMREAIAKFPDAIRAAVREMVEEARELQRREASRLVVPGPGTIPPSGKGPISLR